MGGPTPVLITSACPSTRSSEPLKMPRPEGGGVLVGSAIRLRL
ncbi:MAG: hypothetical protein U0531_06265 [Dehalococcoidia bacterium]